MHTERANAKINLYLDIISRRENGYHDLYSIMQTVSLCDIVKVDFCESDETEIHIEASGSDQMPTDCRNLAWRAAEMYLLALGKRGNVSIRIEKHIPMAAGLAGGSADAAAVLRALNDLCGSPMSREELCNIGVRLGADVPFCIVGNAAIAEGIGEKLTPHVSFPDVPMVIACMGEGVSTPWAYGTLDRLYSGFTEKRPIDRGEKLANSMQNHASVKEMCGMLYNIFESVVPNEHPDVNRLKKTMLDCGAVASMMSGSGPSVFGVFESEEDALNACTALRKMGADVYVCRSTNT